MKSLVNLFQRILTDCGVLCSADTSHDIKTVMTRFGHEGFEFFTRTLPKMGSGLERALDSSKANPDLFPGFRCRQETPILFGDLFDLVFDRATGILLDDPSIDAIFCLRQLTLFYKKIEVDCGTERTAMAFSAFVQSNTDVRNWEDEADVELFDEFMRLARLVFSEPLYVVDRLVRNFELAPAHGSGATADRLLGNKKFEMPMWTDRLESVAPYWRYAAWSGYSTTSYARVDFRGPERELPVKVVHVPKTVETPRIIAEEPTCMQFVQQGIFRALRYEMDQTYLVDLIGTRSQEPNQLLAREGSLFGDLATLDLSEASDRVSNLLVQALFDRFPDLSDAVQACRSRRADVPGHGVIPLARFASMGSALTFPVESMVFLIITLLGMEDALGVRFSKTSEIIGLIGRVRIYGDDIIVPVEAVPSVVNFLEAYGLRVNHHKSFWTGKFRESCGMEYFDGVDVTICRARRVLPERRKDVKELISAVELRNHLYMRGLWTSARWMDDYLTKIIPLPILAETSPALGRRSFLRSEGNRQCPKLQRPQIKAAYVRYTTRRSEIEGEAALMKCLGYRDPVSLEDYEPRYANGDHLRFAGRPDASDIYIGWQYTD